MEDSYHHFNCSSVTFIVILMLMKNNEPSEYMTTSNAYNSQFNNNEKYNKIKMIIIYPLLLKKIQLFM